MRPIRKETSIKRKPTDKYICKRGKKSRKEPTFFENKTGYG